MSWSANVMDWGKYLGKRVLVVSKLNAIIGLTTFPSEAEVVEVSPSGKYVKLRFERTTTWVKADEYVVLEVLD